MFLSAKLSHNCTACGGQRKFFKRSQHIAFIIISDKLDKDFLDYQTKFCLFKHLIELKFIRSNLFYFTKRHFSDLKFKKIHQRPAASVVVWWFPEHRISRND